jgi:hypothetical protein
MEFHPERVGQAARYPGEPGTHHEWRWFAAIGAPVPPFQGGSVPFNPFPGLEYQPWALEFNSFGVAPGVDLDALDKNAAGRLSREELKGNPLV